MQPLHRQALAHLTLAAALSAAAIGLVAEVRRQGAVCDSVATVPQPVLAWRRDDPEVERLSRFLAAACRALPPDATVVGFASPEGPDAASFFRRLWAAYLAPQLNLIAESVAPGYTRYLLAYGCRPRDPGAALIRRLPGGALYRWGPP